MAWIEKFILPVATKIGTEKHLIALRDAFITTLPATMAGSIAVLLNAFLRDFPSDFGWIRFVELMEPIITINGYVWAGTTAVMAVIFATTLGYNLAKAYDVDPLAGAIVSLAAFLMGLTQTATSTLELSEALPQDTINLIVEAGGTVIDGTQVTANAWGYFNFGAHMGGAGLFTAIFFGLISTLIYAKLMLKKITIKMPAAVPPAVAKAFAAIIPALVALYVIGIINYGFYQVTGQAVIDWISETIQTPLLHLSQGFGAVLIIVFLVHTLWFFGLHGTNILAPVLLSIYGTAMNDNMNAYQLGEAIPWNWTAASFDVFVWPGGAGVTLMLIVALLLFSRRADSKTVAKLALAPGVFNINEPVMFGLPIVLNPLYMIPYILAPMATATLSYAATLLGLVNPVVVNVIWVMPAGISGFLATGGDWRAVILTLMNLIVAFLIWAPFVMAANKVTPINHD